MLMLTTLNHNEKPSDIKASSIKSLLPILMFFKVLFEVDVFLFK